MRLTSSLLSLLVAMLTNALAIAQPATTPATTRTAVRPSAQLMSTTELSRRSEIAIAQGVKYLVSKQVEDGWVRESSDGYGIGPTALVTFALLSCGEQPQSPAVSQAIKLLKRVNGRDADKAIYSVGLRASVWGQLPEAMRASELRGDLNWLLGHMMTGTMRGIYNYGARGEGDYSNSQYGVLGVWAAADAGLDVPPVYWRTVEQAWLRGQQDDGGWGYRPNQSTASYASMTAAAVATLYITNDYLHAQDYQDLTKNFRNEPLEKGLQWLGNNFAPDDNTGYEMSRLRRGGGRGFRGFGQGFGGRRGPNPQGAQQEAPTRDPNDPWLNYMLFSYERVGEASGLTRWGTHRWYDEGAEQLIKTQEYDGSWIGRNNPEIETAYALLFLARGRAPVIAQKLEFGDRWNNRPRDMAGFTRFMRHATERHVNWQIVSADATAEEFRNAPLLYTASDVAIQPTESQKKSLKDYINQGGLLVAANEGRTANFSKSIIALCRELFPQYNLRDLPKDHPIYTANFAVRTPTAPIRGLSNGVRELVILYPSGDLPWQWHSVSGAFSTQNSPYASLANLWLYATDRANPRLKGEDVWVDRNPGVTPTKSLKVARISYEGNWDPEPAGWIRLGNILANFDQLEVTLTPTNGAMASDVGLAHLTATKSFVLSPAMETALKNYVNGGGSLLMDAAGGSPEVPTSFEQLIRRLSPNATISPLPLTHPIYRGAVFGGQDIESVDYRRVPNAPIVHIPRLRGAYAQGKLIAIVSNEDLSGGMVGYSHSALVGYAPASATDLMRNIAIWRASAAKAKP